MAKIEGKCREVLDKTEWVAVATTGADGPHLAGTWGGYIRALGIKDDEIILVPAGGLLKTEQNLEKDNRIEILCATQQIQGSAVMVQARVAGYGEETASDFRRTRRSGYEKIFMGQRRSCHKS